MRPSLFLMLVLLGAAAAAQKQGNELIDSLIKGVPAAANDTVRARMLNRVATYYVDVNTDSAMLFATRGMQLTTAMGWKKGIAAFHICFGNTYSTRGELDAALNSYNKALLINIEEKDTINQAVGYNNLGTVANAKSDFIAAAAYFSQSLHLGESSRNYYTIGLANSNLALVYRMQEDYVTAMQYARQSVAAYGAIEDYNMMVNVLSNIGMLFLKQQLYDSAYHYYQQSLQLSRNNDNKAEEATVLNSLSQYHAARKNYEQALDYGLQSKALWDVVDPEHEDAINNLGMIGSYYLQQFNGTGRHDRSLLKAAIDYLTRAIDLCTTHHNRASQSEFLFSLAQANALNGDYAAAYQNNLRYQELKDSIYSQEHKNRIAEAINKLQLDKKNDEIAIKNLTIANQYRQRLFYAGALLFLAIVGALLYWQNRSRKKTNAALLALNQELDESNKVKAKFFSILSHDLKRPVNNIVSYLQLQQQAPDLLDEEVNINTITHAAENLLENMEELLLWSKGQMERFKPHKKTIPVASLFRAIESDFTQSGKVAFRFDVPAGLSVFTDEDYLKTILRNLTANAVKAVAGSPAPDIVWEARETDGHCVFRITDNGIGLNAEQLAAVHRTDLSIGIKSGLGLHLVQDLAKAIQAHVEFAPRPSGGMVVSIVL